MAAPWLRGRLVAVLACACAAAAASAESDTFPGLASDTETVVLLSVVGGLTGLALIACGVRYVTNALALPMLLAMLMWLALVTTCMVVWTVTCTTSRNTIVSNKEAELHGAMAWTTGRIRGMLDVQEGIVEYVTDAARQGRWDWGATYPSAFAELASVYRMMLSAGLAGTVETLYYARAADEVSVGIALEKADAHGPHGNVSLDSADKYLRSELFYGVVSPQATPIPPWVACAASDFPSNATCGAVARGGLGGGCGNTEAPWDSPYTASCLASCRVASSADACYGRAWPDDTAVQSRTPRPTRVLVFDVMWNATDWTFAPLVGAGAAEEAAAAASETADPAYRTLAADNPYRPSGRPWYTREPALVWSAPYTYHTGKAIGITVAHGVYAAAGGAFMGVVALDITLTSMSTFLQTLKTTDNTLVALLNDDAQVLGSALSADELAEELPPGTVDMRDAVPGGRLQRLGAFIDRRFGGYPAMRKAGATLLLDGDEVVLTRPVLSERLRWAVVATLPYSDIMAKTSDAYFLALVLATVVAVVCAVVVFSAVYCALHPVLQLQGHMTAVATMNLSSQEASPHENSRIAEVRGMYDAFGLMVECLREWRQYIPDSCLSIAMDESTVADAHAASYDDALYAPPHDSPSLAVMRGQVSATTSFTFDPATALLTSSWKKSDSMRSKSCSSVSGSDTSSLVDDTASLDRTSSLGGGAAGLTMRAVLLRRGITRAVTLATAAALKTRNMTLSIINMVNFHLHTRALSNDEAIGFHTHYLSNVVSLAKASAGCVDDVGGDHVAVSHNAVMRNVRHQDAAIGMALHITSYFVAQNGYVPKVFTAGGEEAGGHAAGETPRATGKLQPAATASSPRPGMQPPSVAAADGGASTTAVAPPSDAGREPIHIRVNVGIATSQAKVGNMGINGAKRFTVIGECAVVARGVERLGAHLDVPVLASEATCRELVALYAFANVCRARVPRAWYGKPFMCVEVVEHLPPPNMTGEDAEWMYAMEKAMNESPFRDFNGAVVAACEGEYAKADAQLSGVDPDAVGSGRYSGLRTLMEEWRPLPIPVVALAPVVLGEAAHRHGDASPASRNAVARGGRRRQHEAPCAAAAAKPAATTTMPTAAKYMVGSDGGAAEKEKEAEEKEAEEGAEGEATAAPAAGNAQAAANGGGGDTPTGGDVPANGDEPKLAGAAPPPTLQVQLDPPPPSSPAELRRIQSLVRELTFVRAKLNDAERRLLTTTASLPPLSPAGLYRGRGMLSPTASQYSHGSPVAQVPEAAASGGFRSPTRRPIDTRSDGSFRGAKTRRSRRHRGLNSQQPSPSSAKSPGAGTPDTDTDADAAVLVDPSLISLTNSESDVPSP